MTKPGTNRPLWLLRLPADMRATYERCEAEMASIRAEMEPMVDQRDALSRRIDLMSKRVGKLSSINQAIYFLAAQYGDGTADLRQSAVDYADLAIASWNPVSE